MISGYVNQIRFSIALSFSIKLPKSAFSLRFTQNLYQLIASEFVVGAQSIYSATVSYVQPHLIG